MSWITPTSHNDPDSVWTDESNAYDGNTVSYAYTYVAGKYLELNVAAMACDKIRIFARLVKYNIPIPLFTDPDVDIDVYYGSAWNNIYSGTIAVGEWVQKEIGSLQLVTAVRIKSNDALYFNFFDDWRALRLNEVAFWEPDTLVDTNVLIRNYLLTSTALTIDLIALIGSRLYCPRLPEKATLPAISYFTRGGVSDPNVRNIFSPSVQFDCWASNSIDAREVYRALYDALQGLGNAAVTVSGVTNYITKAREEVQGQDLVDTEIPNYFRVLTFYSITIRDNL